MILNKKQATCQSWSPAVSRSYLCYILRSVIMQSWKERENNDLKKKNGMLCKHLNVYFNLYLDWISNTMFRMTIYTYTLLLGYLEPLISATHWLIPSRTNKMTSVKTENISQNQINRWPLTLTVNMKSQLTLFIFLVHDIYCAWLIRASYSKETTRLSL